MLKNRNIALVIILSIITCGIYQLYWLWVTISALDNEGQNSNMPAVAQFILMFFYVGFILFGLNADANINAIKAKRGIPASDNKVLYIILGIFLPIVLVCLVQNESTSLHQLLNSFNIILKDKGFRHIPGALLVIS